MKNGKYLEGLDGNAIVLIPCHKSIEGEKRCRMQVGDHLILRMLYPWKRTPVPTEEEAG